MLNKLRQESIRKIFDLYETEPPHAYQVTKLALIIFDKTFGLIHNMGDNERDLLEAGALLHDIGYYISAKSHNKNAYKLIEKELIPGFTELEKEIIGNITRYHRGKLPQKKHKNYSDLSIKDRSLVNKLSAFVRLADALDRSHRSVINDIDILNDSFYKILIVILKLKTPDCASEIWKAKDKKDLFEKEFNLQLKFEVAKAD